MLTSLFLHPEMVLPLWRRALVGARQPARVDFRLTEVARDGRARRVARDECELGPMAVLSRFELLDEVGAPAPALPELLLIPPMAGGFPFILRDVAAWFLGRARVHVLEWINVRERPEAGPFLVDDQTEAVGRALAKIGRPAHVAGFCQAGFAAVAACAFAAAGGWPAAAAAAPAPLSLTLVASPIDARAAPSAVGERIAGRGVDLFRSRRGGRRDPETGIERGVYPAEVQLGVVMNTIAAQNPETHEFSRLILRDEGENPRAAPFLEMATALMDLPWEHFRDTLERIYFDDGPVARRLRLRERPAPLSKLDATPVLVVEGARDALVAPGQCAAIFDALPAADPALRRRVVVEEAGHFGLFYGDRWRAETAPAMAALIEDAEARASAAAGPRRAAV